MIEIQECGILLRGYAKSKEEAENVAERLCFSVRRAHELGFGRIEVLVPKEKDCGATCDAVAARISGVQFQMIYLNGNENSDILNVGLESLRMCGKDYSFIVSNKAIGYLNTANVEKMLEAFDDGALAVGLALRDTDIPEDEDDHYLGILEGRLSNTLAAWNISSLESVGGFDSAIGVEEIAPIARLIKENSACIAPVFPTEMSDLNVSPLRADRHERIMSSKKKRQLQEADRVNGSFALIEQGILLGYPK